MDALWYGEVKKKKKLKADEQSRILETDGNDTLTAVQLVVGKEGTGKLGVRERRGKFQDRKKWTAATTHKKVSSARKGEENHGT